MENVLNVLLFEDNPVYNKDVKEMLENQLGYKVNAFQHYAEAIKALESGYLPDIAILDIVYEGKARTPNEIQDKIEDAGFRIAEKLEKVTPILFFSAYGNSEEVKNTAKKYDPLDFINKSTDGKDLNYLIKKVNRQFDDKREEYRLKHFFNYSYKGKFSCKQTDFYKEDNITVYRVLSQDEIVCLESFNENNVRNEFSHKKGLGNTILRDLMLKAKTLGEHRGNESFTKVVYKLDRRTYALLRNDSWNNLANYDSKLGEILLKNKKDWSDVEKHLIDSSLAQAKGGLNRLVAPLERRKRIDELPSEWEKLEESFLELNEREQLADIVQFGEEEIIFSHFIDRSGIRIKLVSGDHLDVANVDPGFFIEQLHVIERVVEEASSSLQAIGKNGQGYINLDHVVAFSERFVEFRGGNKLLDPPNMLFNRLKMLFPYINTSIPTERLAVADDF